MRFSRQEYWSGLPFSSPGDLPDPGFEPGSPALQADSFPTELQWVAGGLINGQVHPLRAGGRQRAPRPLEEQEGMAGPILYLPSVSWGTAPWLWNRGDQYVQTDRGETGPPQSQLSWTQSGCADELERLMGADSKEACLFEDLELLCECGGGWR